MKIIKENYASKFLIISIAIFLLYSTKAFTQISSYSCGSLDQSTVYFNEKDSSFLELLLDSNSSILSFGAGRYTYLDKANKDKIATIRYEKFPTPALEHTQLDVQMKFSAPADSLQVYLQFDSTFSLQDIRIFSGFLKGNYVFVVPTIISPGKFLLRSKMISNQDHLEVFWLLPSKYPYFINIPISNYYNHYNITIRKLKFLDVKIVDGGGHAVSDIYDRNFVPSMQERNLFSKSFTAMGSMSSCSIAPFDYKALVGKLKIQAAKKDEFYPVYQYAINFFESK